MKARAETERASASAVASVCTRTSLEVVPDPGGRRARAWPGRARAPSRWRWRWSPRRRGARSRPAGCRRPACGRSAARRPGCRPSPRPTAPARRAPAASGVASASCSRSCSLVRVCAHGASLRTRPAPGKCRSGPSGGQSSARCRGAYARGKVAAMRASSLVLALALVLLGAPAAEAFVIQEKGGPQSASNGIVARPGRQLLGRRGVLGLRRRASRSTARHVVRAADPDEFGNGSRPIGVADGPGGRVWVAATGRQQARVVRRARRRARRMHDVPTGHGLRPGRGRRRRRRAHVLLAPSPTGTATAASACSAPSRTTARARSPTRGAGGGTSSTSRWPAASSSRPDFDGDIVRRLVARHDPRRRVDDRDAHAGRRAGRHHLRRRGQRLGDGVDQRARSRASRPPSRTGRRPSSRRRGGTLTNPFGILAGTDGRIYVAGKGSSNIVRLNPDGTGFRSTASTTPSRSTSSTARTATSGSPTRRRPASCASSTARRGPPPARRLRPARPPARPTARSTRAATTTQVVFDYGPTEAYGKTSAADSLPAGAAVVAVAGILTGLTSGDPLPRPGAGDQRRGRRPRRRHHVHDRRRSPS